MHVCSTSHSFFLLFHSYIRVAIHSGSSLCKAMTPVRTTSFNSASFEVFAMNESISSGVEQSSRTKDLLVEATSLAPAEFERYSKVRFIVSELGASNLNSASSLGIDLSRVIVPTS